MRITNYYDEYHVPLPVSKLLWSSRNLSEFRKLVEKLETKEEVLPFFNKISDEKYILDYPLDLTEEAGGVLKLHLKNVFGHDQYMELKHNKFDKKTLFDALIRAVGKIQTACECNGIENGEDFTDVYELIETLKGD